VLAGVATEAAAADAGELAGFASCAQTDPIPTEHTSPATTALHNPALIPL
jgi:hypothetical protein